MNKWIFTFEELLELKKKNFNDYTLFLKSRLGKRHDGSYICGTATYLSNEEIKDDFYKNYIYLITDIDTYNGYITFNQIGTIEEILQELEIKVNMETKIGGKKIYEILHKANKE